MSIEIIKTALPTIPTCSGIYQFFDSANRVLYVGKAKNLRKRIANYTNKNGLSLRILRMVSLAQKIEVVRTGSEVEALLLEHNLIKKFLPHFNILLKDDKTFPQILITNHQFPQIAKFRGIKSNKGSYFGPFANIGDVNRTIDILRKNFAIRNCSDAEFNSRTKPCLEYQIKKCSAPCVGLISDKDYQNSVKNAILVLSGKSDIVQQQFRQKMLEHSNLMEYEKAMLFRDRIKAIDSIQAKQNINFSQAKNFDVITVVAINQRACIYISFYRLGQNYGARPYFFEIEDEEKNLSVILSSFLGQFYLSQTPPNLLVLGCEIEEGQVMADFLSMLVKESQSNESLVSATDEKNEFLKKSEFATSKNHLAKSFYQKQSKKVEILVPKKGDKLALIKDQELIALQILEQKISHNMSNKQLLLEVKKIFDLPRIPQRIEVYDNSHISGENAVGAMITAGVDGFIKSGYRKFNIRAEEIVENAKFESFKNSPKDDTAMLRQVLMRRFSKLKTEDFPDLIIIDGGKGQLSSAAEIFFQLKIKIPFVCMSKGENRNAGEEWFHQVGKESFTLEKHSPVMHYLQRLRDEAHRFAITTHRKKRQKAFLPS